MDVQVPYDGLTFIVRGKFYPSRPAITWGPPENREPAEDAWWGSADVFLVTAGGEEIEFSAAAMDHLANIDGHPIYLYDYLLDAALPIADKHCREPEAA